MSNPKGSKMLQFVNYRMRVTIRFRTSKCSLTKRRTPGFSLHRSKSPSGSRYLLAGPLTGTSSMYGMVYVGQLLSPNRFRPLRQELNQLP